MAANRHALLSPSSASRWLQCPASVPLTMNLAKSTSKYALEGQKAHELAELLLKKENVDLSVYGKDMYEYVKEYVDFVHNLCDSDSNLFIEKEFSITSITDEKDAVGTIDACVLSKSGVLHIIDLKYGEGVKVYAENNPQGLMYAGAAYNVFKDILKIKEIRISIVQPRLDNIQTWSLSTKDFLKILKDISTKAKKITAHLESKTTDELQANPCISACRFCKASGRCKAYADYVLKAAVNGSEGVHDMSADELANAYSKVVLVEAWVNSIRSEVMQRLMNGKAVTGYKLVNGRKSAAKWIDDEKVMSVLAKLNVAEQSYLKTTVKLATPTQLEKAFKQGELEPHEWEALTTYIAPVQYAPEVALESSSKAPYGGVDINDLPTFN